MRLLSMIFKKSYKVVVVINSDLRLFFFEIYPNGGYIETILNYHLWTPPSLLTWQKQLTATAVLINVSAFSSDGRCFLLSIGYLGAVHKLATEEDD